MKPLMFFDSRGKSRSISIRSGSSWCRHMRWRVTMLPSADGAVPVGHVDSWICVISHASLWVGGTSY